MKIFKITLQAAALIYCLPLLANPLLSPYGVTDGGASHHGAMNLSGNPAAPSSIRWEYDSQSSSTKNRSFDSGFALGIGRFGAAVNSGEVDDIYDEADRVYEDLDQSTTNSELAEVSADIENVLQLLEEDGYVNVKAYGAVAPLEIASQKLGGVWSFHPHLNFDSNANFSGSTVECRSSLDPDGEFYNCSQYLTSDESLNMSNCSRYVLSLADDPGSVFNFDSCENEIETKKNNGDTLNSCESSLDQLFNISGGTDTTDLTDAISADCEFEMNSDAAMHLRLAMFTGFGVGYSTKAYELDSGDIFVGLRGKYLSSNLYTTKKTYNEIVDEYDNDTEKMLEDIRSDYDANATDGTGYALDLGLLWTMKYGRIGLSVDNVFASEFDYLDEDGILQSYQLPQQTRVELSLYPEGRWMHLSYVQELEEVEAFSGERTQWRNISVGFTPYVAILHARIGQSEEQVSGLSYITGGISLFSVVHIDGGISTDTVEVEGEEQPRGIYGSVSVEFIF